MVVGSLISIMEAVQKVLPLNGARRNGVQEESVKK